LLLGLQDTVLKYIKPGVVGCKYRFRCKFPQVCFCQKFAKLVNDRRSYRKHNK